MKKIAVIILLICSQESFPQSKVDKFLDSTVKAVKAVSPIDKSDLQVYSILDAVYEEVLQSNGVQISPATSNRINALLDDEKAKNKHLLVLFLMYQDHIGQTAAEKRPPNSEFQLATIGILEKEFEAIYQKVPVIIYIYKAESLGGARRDKEANEVVESGLKKYPNSIPLKVYKYLNTQDETVKKDLVTKHSKHWMVELFGIK